MMSPLSMTVVQGALMGSMNVLAVVQGGGYISTLKVIPVLIILLIWVRLLNWVDKDAEAAHLPRVGLNLGSLVGLILAFALFLYMPGFLFGLAVLLVVFGVEAGIYLNMRNKVVGLGDLKKQFRLWLKSFRSKKEVKAETGQVQIFKDGKPAPIPAADSLDRPAFDAVQQALTDPMVRSAEQVDLTPDNGAVGVKYWVDCFPYTGTPIERQLGADAISYLKWAANLAIEDRRKPQNGTIKSTFNGKKHEFKIQTAGTTAGEYVRIMVDPKKRHDYTIDTLGFSEAQKKTLKESIKENSGLVLVATPKGHGLTSLSYGILKAHDVVLQFIQSVERFQEEDIEGVTQNKIPPTANGAEELKMVDWVVSQQPDVVLIDKVEDPKTASIIMEAAKSGKRIYVAMRAGTTFEALDQWRRLVGDNRLATDGLKMVVAGRVLRKLCMACKVAYSPDPATLKKLNMSPDKVSQLFQARSQPLMDPKGRPIPCEFCHDMRFKGRTGVFEFLTVDDDIRQAVEASRPLNQPFRKQRGRYMQEEALALVEAGETSVQEMIRVLKGTGESQGGTGGRTASTAPRRPAPTGDAA